MRKSVLLSLALLGTAGLGAAFHARAQLAMASPTQKPAVKRAQTALDERWRESLEAFAAADQANAPRHGGVLFVGSSSIRLWSDLEREFEDTNGVVKRGFGGSRMADVARYVDQLVLPYKPRLVVVYAGDNDLAEGHTPQEVLASFASFVRSVQEALPGTRIAYLSIKPSPLRRTLMPQAAEANRLIAALAQATPGLDYIDVYSRMLDDEGHPRRDLYGADSLHLNTSGYALWKAAITPHLAAR